MTAALDPERVPTHIAIIMDGNGRWANARGLDRTAGHARGEPVLYAVLEEARRLGVGWLTAFTFSTENWSRPQYEVDFLMNFNIDLLQRRRDELHADNVRIHFIGDRDDPRVPPRLLELIADAEEVTRNNTGMRMVYAFNYGGRAELLHAARHVASRVTDGELAVDAIDEDALVAGLYVPDMPDPELVIRTSGEQRISNFLLWEAAYSEFVFTPVLWPDFTPETLVECIIEYQQRKRRFGGVEAPS